MLKMSVGIVTSAAVECLHFLTACEMKINTLKGFCSFTQQVRKANSFSDYCFRNRSEGNNGC